MAERELKPGDRVVVGDSVIEAVNPETLTTSATTVQLEPVDGSGIDLGFARDRAVKREERAKMSLRPLLWGAAGIVMVAAAAAILLGTPPSSDGIGALRPALTADHPRIISLAYEKVEASSEGIFRYMMSVTADRSSADGSALLRVAIDDALTDSRHIDKKKTISGAALERLALSINASGVMGLEREYAGIAPAADQLKSTRLKIVRNDTIFETAVENSTLPDELRNVTAVLEAFSKNELGIWAIQYSTDKLVEMANEALAAGDAKWEEREVQYGNIAAAIRFYREGIADLETVNPKPEFHSTLVNRLNTAVAELERRYREQMFQADRAIQLSEWENARTELKIVCELVPDEQDSRHADAAAKLLDVEGRMKRK